MEDVEFLDSTGLGVLVGGLKKVRAHDGSMELVCTQDRLLKIFRITGLAKVFTDPRLRRRRSPPADRCPRRTYAIVPRRGVSSAWICALLSDVTPRGAWSRSVCRPS